MSSVTFAGEAIRWQGRGPAPKAIVVRGARASSAGEVVESDGGWHATVPLRAARWNGPELPLPTGEYAVRLIDADGAEHEPDGQLPITVLGDLRAELQRGTLTVGPPLDPVYDTGEGQAALERRYASRPAATEPGVFFESFYGRAATCNPRAIDTRLAELRPELTRYWSVIDRSIPVPEGAVPVIEGSPQWWRARGTARLLVVNDWLRRRFVRGSGQHVLQTWHGSPLKRLALDRPGFDPRRALAVVRESRRWDHLLAQNPYTEKVFRRAYRFRRPVWVEGYPRNDVLIGGTGSAARRALGLSDADRVLLYAPTWRDDREVIVDHLDAAALARDTGAVVLVRGHSRTLLPGTDTRHPRVIDVTSYPDTADLMLAADALITDYSSIMFDFSVTGKPMYFFVPDMERYRGDLRGFYFDLPARAPGPVVSTYDRLVDALADSGAGHEAAYAQWRAIFNARDDGHASERVVSRILDQRLV